MMNAPAPDEIFSPVGEEAADYGEVNASPLLAKLKRSPDDLHAEQAIQLELTRAYLSGALRGIAAARKAFNC